MMPEMWTHQATEVDQYGDTPARGLLWSMRTGKTRVVVESASRLHEAGEITGLLVTAPNGVHAQWAEYEIPKWAACPVGASLTWRSKTTGQADVAEFLKQPQRQGLHVLALNVESLQIRRVQDLVRAFLKAHGGGERVMIAFDESHDFRRPGARRTRLARGLARKCGYRRILSGTAALNSPMHLFSQFELLEPCALGHKTFASFKSYHAEFRQGRTRDGRSYPQLVGYHNLEELRNWVGLWASVVPRSQADVPDVLNTRRTVVLSLLQQRAYDDLRRDALRVEAEGGGEVEVKAHLMKLQQVLGGFVLDELGKVHSVDKNPPRLAAMLDEVLGSEPCKVIVWCRFREDIRRCVGALKKIGVETVEYHGGVNASNRKAAIGRFQEGAEPVVFVGQPQAAGLGLNLSAASTIVWYSHVHDAIVREQASARASAKGGDPVVMVDLVAEGTLDIGMLEVLSGKVSLAEALTGEGLAALLSGSPSNTSNLRLSTDEISEYGYYIKSGSRSLRTHSPGGSNVAKRKQAASKKKGTKKAVNRRTGPTIGETACATIKGGATNAEALAVVKKAHPDGKTTMASVAWYRNDMRKAGMNIKTSREISAKARAKTGRKAKATKRKKS